MSVQHACQQEQLGRQRTEHANIATANRLYFETEFQPEPHTLWGEIKYAVSAKTRAGSVDLKPGDFVWVRARSSEFAQINTSNGTEAVIPLSAIEFGAVTK
jgi:hypothetical protein